MVANRQAWTRKRPGQASASDQPRHPLPRRSGGPPDYTEEFPIGMSKGGPPSPQDSRADYEEQVPFGISQQNATPPPPPRQSMSRHSPTPRDSRRGPVADYEEDVPIGISRQNAPPPPPPRQSMSRHSPTRGDSRRAPTAEYEEEVPTGGPRRGEPAQVSQHQSSRTDRDFSPSRRDGRQDSQASQEQLPRSSIHEPQRQRSRQESRATGYLDDERYAPMPIRRASHLEPRAKPGLRVTFQEPLTSGRKLRREDSSSERQRDSRR